jgi:PTH1 family peptidyl-tRNA hydrolase
VKLLVGLGNPGKQYEQTRHNIGFIVADHLADANNFGPTERQFDGELRKGELLGQRFLIFKPMTFMNLSGRAVAPLMRYFRIEVSDLIVVFDDVDLDPGRVKSRSGGGHGGHNGVRSLLADIGDHQFHRIKIGVGKPTPGNVSDWVLGKMSKDELEHLGGPAITDVLDRIRSIILQERSSQD